MQTGGDAIALVFGDLIKNGRFPGKNAVLE
jgi:hypothetical protein